MTIQLSQKLKRELAGVIEYGYRSPKAFVEDAIRHRIFELRKEGFLTKTKRVRAAMKRKGISESGILKDFEKTRSS
jgi:metal-responsive CopG/Arc/MetJ family transcriptional regulator